MIESPGIEENKKVEEEEIIIKEVPNELQSKSKEKENFRKEPETREVGRRLLFRGRGKIPQRGRREIIVRETVNNIKTNVNVEPGVDRVVEVEEKVIQRDTGKDLDVRSTEEKMPLPIENFDRKFEREVNNSQRYQKREIFRERNQREFERERPRQREIERESEDNNGEEDEKEEDEEDSQNENESAREIGRNRMAEIGNKRFYRGGMRKERFKRKSESDEESYE